MILAVDANALVGRLLSAAGRILIADDRLELFAADVVWTETEHNLGRRVQGMLKHKRISTAAAAFILTEALQFGRAHVQIVPASAYAYQEVLARRRMPHDVTDWPTIAVALGFDAAIWTEDRHFHGCGLPCWTAETLARELAALPPA